MQKWWAPKIFLALALIAGIVLASCNFTADTDGHKDIGITGGVVAAASTSSITGTGGTSTAPATVQILLRGKGGTYISGVTPTFTVTNPTANDFAFTCGATGLNGTASCTFRSYDAGVAKTLKILTPVVKTGDNVTFTQAASQITMTTQPVGNIVDTAYATQPVITLKDPLGAAVVGDSSTVVTATLNTVSSTTSGTPVLKKNGVACNPCTFTAVNGVVDFGLAANRLSSTYAGTFTLTFTATGMTSVNSSQFTVSPGEGATLSFTQQPQSSVAPLENFSPQPIVKVLDSFGNIVTTDPVLGNGDDAAAVVTMSLVTVTSSGTNTLLGSTAKTSDAGVANYENNALRIDSTSGGTFKLRASATIAAGAVTADSSQFTVSQVGIPYKLSYSTQPSQFTTSGIVLIRQPVVKVLDVNGSLVTNNNSLQITLSAVGTGCTIGGTSPRTVVNGVATFNDITLTNAGTTVNCQIIATTTGSVISKVSDVVNVGNANTIPLALNWINTPASTGKNQTIASTLATALQIEVLDGAGTGVGHRITTDYTTSVTISIYSGTGTLSGTVSQTAVAGVASFGNLSINQTGTFILRASASGLSSGDSSSFVINTQGTASKLVFTQQPTSETAGTTFTTMPIVQIQDDFGNLVTSANSVNVTMACSNPSGCTLDGSPAIVTAVNGVATWVGSSLRISNKSGNNIALTASATGLLSGSTPAAFVIAPAAASNSTSSIAATCPTAINTANGLIVVVVKDQFGNARVGDSVTIDYTNAPTCSGACSTTDANGSATCNFSCTAAGTQIFAVTTPAAIVKTAVCGF